MIDFLPLIGLVVAVSLSLFRWKRLDGFFKGLSCFLIIELVAESFSLSTALGGLNNIAVYNVYVVVNFCCTSLLILWLLGRTVLAIILGFVATSVLILILTLLFRNGLNEFDSIPRGVTAFFICVFALLYLLHRVYFDGLETRKRSRDLVMISFLFYFGMSFISFLSINELLMDYGKIWANKVWLIHIFYCFVFYLMILVGISIHIKENT